MISRLLSKPRIFTLVKVRGLDVSSHGWKGNSNAVNVLVHEHLAAQSRSLGQTIGKVQHIVLVIGWLWKGVDVLWINNHVTSGASARATAGALHLEVVILSNVQDGVALGNLIGLLLTLLGDKGDL